MIYADTDFFLALIKKDDWLNPGAEKLYKENKGRIMTSMATVIEIAIVCKKKNLDPEIILGSLFEIADVDGISSEEAMQAAHLIKNENVTVFDSFHAVLSKDMPVVSSDKVYDRLGKERIKLESKD